MSVAAILRSRLPSAVTRPLSSWALPALGRQWAPAGGAVGVVGGPSWRPSVVRSVWLEVVRQVPSEDPSKVGQLTFEDPDLADFRIGRAVKAEFPLVRKPRKVRHEKKWMRRKRLKMERRYRRLEEGVNELKAYIKFKHENRPEW